MRTGDSQGRSCFSRMWHAISHLLRTLKHLQDRKCCWRHRRRRPLVIAMTVLRDCRRRAATINFRLAWAVVRLRPKLIWGFLTWEPRRIPLTITIPKYYYSRRRTVIEIIRLKWDNKKLSYRWETARRICALCNGATGWAPKTPLPMYVTTPNLVVLCQRA